MALIRARRDDIPVVGFFEDATQFRMILRKFLMGEEGAGDARSSAHWCRADTDQADQIRKYIDGAGIGMQTCCGFRLTDRDRRLGVITSAILDLIKSSVVSQWGPQVNAESQVVATQKVVIHPFQRGGRDADDSAAVVDLFTGADRQLLQAGHIRHVGMGHFFFDDLESLRAMRDADVYNLEGGFSIVHTRQLLSVLHRLRDSPGTDHPGMIEHCRFVLEGVRTVRRK